MMKSEWPEVVGMDYAAAAATIMTDRPDVNPYLLPPGAIFTMEVRNDRVWLHINSDGFVQDPSPKVG